jgi:hypothetical protein
MPHLAGAKSQELVSRMLVSLAAGHKSNEGPAFKAIARRNQQSYELVEFVDCRSWFVQPQRGSCLDTRTLTFAVPAVAALLYLLG